MTSESGCRKYVYGVIPAAVARELDFGQVGLGVPPQTVETVIEGSLAALVSNVDGPVNPSPDDALAHERVLGLALAAGDVVPFAFGHVLDSREAVVNLLDEYRNELDVQLKLVSGHVETGLKVFWKKESFLSEILTPEIRELRDQIYGSAREDAYSLKLKLGELVKAAVDDRRSRYEGLIVPPLRRVATAHRINVPLVPRMVLNASFLVPRDDQMVFDEAVSRLGEAHAEVLDFRLSGPWPPYNFVNLNLKQG